MQNLSRKTLSLGFAALSAVAFAMPAATANAANPYAAKSMNPCAAKSMTPCAPAKHNGKMNAANPCATKK